jgi:type IV secretory pathway TrbL component
MCCLETVISNFPGTNVKESDIRRWITEKANNVSRKVVSSPQNELADDTNQADARDDKTNE